MRQFATEKLRQVPRRRAPRARQKAQQTTVPLPRSKPQHLAPVRPEPAEGSWVPNQTTEPNSKSPFLLRVKPGPNRHRLSPGLAGASCPQALPQASLPAAKPGTGRRLNFFGYRDECPNNCPNNCPTAKFRQVPRRRAPRARQKAEQTTVPLPRSKPQHLAPVRPEPAEGSWVPNQTTEPNSKSPFYLG